MRIDPKSRFSERVENYIRYRPGYPPEALDFLTGTSLLDKRSVVADIGSGTGILTELFLQNGNEVFAVEPNAPMREAAEKALTHYPGFHSVNGTAEATTLPDGSIHLVVAGQAAHWFNIALTKKEFTRILRPGGGIALIWNERRTDTPFLKAYEALLNEFATDYKEVNHMNLTPEKMAGFFSSHHFRSEVFANEQLFDFEGLQGRLLSSSYAPGQGQPRHREMLRELRRIFDNYQTGNKVRFEYDTRLYWGKSA